MLFQILGKDYTRKIIQGTYKVNEEDVYTSWTDANRVEHRQLYRTKLQGTFEMYFSSQEDWETFIEDMASAKTAGGYHTIGIMANNTHTWYQLKELYVSYAPTRQQKVLGKAWYPSVSIKVEER